MNQYLIQQRIPLIIALFGAINIAIKNGYNLPDTVLAIILGFVIFTPWIISIVTQWKSSKLKTLVCVAFPFFVLPYRMIRNPTFENKMFTLMFWGGFILHLLLIAPPVTQSL